MKPFRLTFGLQHYAWGKLGHSSMMRKLGIITEDSEHLHRPVAEAWAGAHPAAPSTLFEHESAQKNLLELLKNNPHDVLGRRVYEKFGGELPFLLKILSIETPLSIQVHPDLAKAGQLNQRFPERYPEANHKPELGVAVEPTTLLFGFRPMVEIRELLKLYPELHSLTSSPELHSEERFLEEIFSRLLLSDSAAAAETLSQRLQLQAQRSPEEEMFLTLHRLYPGDTGVFQIFILNFVSLLPGDAIAVPPNTPHAYLSGDLVECMAASDFVIRAGLTPKPKDVPALLETVEYKAITTWSTKCAPQFGSQFGLFETNESEFQVERSSGSVNEEIKPEGPTLYFALSGKGEIQTMPGETLSFSAPELVLVPGVVQAHRIGFDGVLFRITVPK